MVNRAPFHGENPMNPRRKRRTPREFGGILYELLRREMASPGPLSIGGFIGRLEEAGEHLHQQHAGGVAIGVMFAATLALERSTTAWIAREAARGMRGEFSRHLHEQGASIDQVREWEAVIRRHFGMYRAALLRYEGLEPPWKLGRRFLWHLTGTEEYDAHLVKEATLYLLAARDRAQEIVNRYGPTIVVELS
jgi:hypothetical protein